MSFRPPRCPNTSCPHHRDPEARFYWRHGSYRARCRAEAVPRFRCRHCGRGFSRQTFRHDYRDRRPDRNELVFQLLASGMGLRQASRVTGLKPTSVQKKMQKIGRTCRWLHRNLCTRLPAGCTFLLDEEETYESASIRPLTMPLLMECSSWFVVALGAGPIRRLAPEGSKRRFRQDREEREKGPRRDRSRRCTRVALGRLAQRVGPEPFVIRTDEKASYRALIREVFGRRARLETTLGSLARTTRNPLFPINTAMAMTRDNNGRLRRRSWLVTKRARCLRLQLQIFGVYRNYVRKRFNRDKDERISSAAWLGLLPRAMTWSEPLLWRQDWGPRSIHPMSPMGERTVAEKLPLAS